MSLRLNRTARRSGGRRTAVVKANYVKTREAGAHRRVGASADYYGQDKDIDGSYKGELEAFDHERDDLGKEDVNAFHQDNFGEHKYCYRVTLSPGTDLGPDEMRDFVRDSMSDLEAIRGHEIDYQAYVHDDHEHPHAHVMFYEDTTLRKAELNEWRQEATVHAQELELDSSDLNDDLEMDNNLQLVESARALEEENLHHPQGLEGWDMDTDFGEHDPSKSEIEDQNAENYLSDSDAAGGSTDDDPDSDLGLELDDYGEEPKHRSNNDLRLS